MFLAFAWSGFHKFTTIAWPIGSPPVASCLDDVLQRVCQDYVLIQTLGDATNMIRSVAWSGHLLAAAGDDKQVRLYSASQDSGSLASSGVS